MLPVVHNLSWGGGQALALLVGGGHALEVELGGDPGRWRRAQPGRQRVGQLQGQRRAGTGRQAGRPQQERPHRLVLLVADPARVEGGGVVLQPRRGREADRRRGGQGAALAQDQGPGDQVPEPLVVPGEQDEHDRQEAAEDQEVDQPQQPPDGRVPEPDRRPLLGDHPQPEGRLAQRPPPPQGLEGDEVAEPPRRQQDQHDGQGHPVGHDHVARLPEQGHREQPGQDAGDHDHHVDQVGEDARAKVGRPELERHRLRRDHPGRLELAVGHGRSGVFQPWERVAWRNSSGWGWTGRPSYWVDSTIEVRISPCWPTRSSSPSKCSMEAARTFSIEQ